MSTVPHVFHIHPIDATARSDADVLDLRWIAPIQQCQYPTRFLTSTVPLNLQEATQELQSRKQVLHCEFTRLQDLADALTTWTDETVPHQFVDVLATFPDHLQARIEGVMRHQDRTQRASWVTCLDTLARVYWPLHEWLDSYIYHYETTMPNDVHMRALTHHCVQWVDSQDSSDRLLQQLQHGFQVGVTRVPDVPLLIPSTDSYDAYRDHLAPRNSSLPFLAFLVVTEMVPERWWTIRTWDVLFDLPVDVSLCLDMGIMSQFNQDLQVKREVVIRGQAGDSALDPRADKKRAGAQQMQEQLADNQQMHLVRIVLAIKANSRTQLRSDVKQVQNACHDLLKCTVRRGKQHVLADFFSTTATSMIDAHVAPIKEPSHGVAVTVPWGYYRPPWTKGLYWGLDGKSPIFFDPIFTEDGSKTAGHVGITGDTGTGKTTFLNAMMLRMQMKGYQGCLFEPQGHGELLANAIGSGAKHVVLSPHHRVNPLDIMVTRITPEQPPDLTEQIQAFQNHLAIIMGRSRPRKEGWFEFAPRDFSYIELPLIENAAEVVYVPWKDNLDACTPEKAPLLEDFVQALSELAIDKTLRRERDRLVQEINLTFLKGPKRHIYNQRTTIAFDVGAYDFIAYDFSKMVEGPTQLLMTMKALNAVDGYVMSPLRDRQRPFVCAIDEFTVQAQKAPMLATLFAEMATRRWRTRTALLMSLDQHVDTWLKNPSLRIMFDQCPIKITFAQSLDKARQLLDIIDTMQPHHAEQIAQFQRGEFLLIRKNYVDPMSSYFIHTAFNQLTSTELRYFHGT